MDKTEIQRFIEYQFLRLPNADKVVKDFFIRMIDEPNRSKWWLLCCVVKYIEGQLLGVK
jgi:hypothetical protein